MIRYNVPSCKNIIFLRSENQNSEKVKRYNLPICTKEIGEDLIAKPITRQEKDEVFHCLSCSIITLFQTLIIMIIN